jgi:hypothetical protein
MAYRAMSSGPRLRCVDVILEPRHAVRAVGRLVGRLRSAFTLGDLRVLLEADWRKRTQSQDALRPARHGSIRQQPAVAGRATTSTSDSESARRMAAQVTRNRRLPGGGLELARGRTGS